MTDKLRAAAEMALQALECSYNPSADAQNEAITALRQALDQLPDTTKMIEKPPKTEWQGLTDKQIIDTSFAHRFVNNGYSIVTKHDLIQFAKEIENKLREKNG